MMQKIDKKIIDVHQEVYLCLYDLTGITVGMLLFANMIVENVMFLWVSGELGFFVMVCDIGLTIFYYFLHVLQVLDKIKIYNDVALSWENNFIWRVFCLFNTAIMFIFVRDWRFVLVFIPYLLALYLPAVKIRERDKERFKIVKWVTA